MAKSKQETVSTHPVEAMNKDIEKRGIVVVDEVNRLPVYGEPYISNHLLLVINHEGVSHGEYDMQPVTFCHHDFSVIYPNHTILANDSSDDYRVTLVIISNSFYEQLRHRLTYGNSQVFHSQPTFHLGDEQYKCICDTVKLLKTVSQMDFNRSKEVIASILDTLSLMADEFRQKAAVSTRHQGDKASNSSGDDRAVVRTYFNHFYECLVNHFHESREVRYYARELSLSPKYFGRIIKQETGVSAGEWIARYIVIRAKTLLRYQPYLTIQQISHQLGFSDATTFARYFRTSAGMTPKEYRENTLEWLSTNCQSCR